MSDTVTVNVQEVVPQLFVAVSTTVVTPLLKAEPLPVPLPLPVVTPEKAYVTVGVGFPAKLALYVTAAVHCPVAVFTVCAVGQVVVLAATHPTDPATTKSYAASLQSLVLTVIVEVWAPSDVALKVTVKVALWPAKMGLPGVKVLTANCVLLLELMEETVNGKLPVLCTAKVRTTGELNGVVPKSV